MAFSIRARPSFDIFCQVIDNYGDIGVCWRLARQLAQAPYHCNVRLWVDNLNCFQRLLPTIHTDAVHQRHNNVDILHWQTLCPAVTPHDVVIEAFGCDLPGDFVANMAQHDCLWLNLEYLSAESWVDSFHRQVSIMSNGQRKIFFFPGFTPNTGGLLREPDLIQRRNAWQAQPQQRSQLLQSLQLPDNDIHKIEAGTTQLLFLFCYPDAPVPTLINSLSAQAQDSVILLPDGVCPHATSSKNQRVRVHRIPFVSQLDFDHLLWSSDLNIVRGEDSLVRAMWAARPMIWQPYPQDDDAHLAKLDAWLARSPLDDSTQTLIRSWSNGNTKTLEQKLLQYAAPVQRIDWQAHCSAWAQDLQQHDDLALSLVNFYAQWALTG